MTQIESDLLGSGAVGGSVEVGAFEWNATTTVQQVNAGVLSDGAALYGATVETVATDTDLRVSFPAPPETLVAGTGDQEFRVLVRKSAGTGTPTVRLELWNAGSFISTLLANTGVTNTTGVIHSVTWNASSLSDLTGENVELRVVGLGVLGGATVEVGAIEWNAMGFTAQILAGYVDDDAQLYGARLAGEPTTLSAGSLGDAAQVYGAEVKGPVLAASFLGALTAGPYPAGQWLVRSVADDHQLFGATLSSGASGGYERVKPNQILAIAGLSGAVTDIDDDPDDPDSAFLGVS